MKILIAIATSYHLEAITYFAARLLPATPKTITLMRVIRRESQRPAAANLLASAAAQLTQAGLHVTPLLRLGAAAKSIVDEASAGSYDLVIIGHGDSGTQKPLSLAGPVARQVVAHAPCPILVVGRQNSVDPDHILLCDAGVEAPSFIERLAAQLPGLLYNTKTVTVLHVMSQISAAPGIPGKQLRADADELIQEHAPEGRLLERDAALLQRFQVRVQPKVRHGQVVQEILAEANSGNYGLVVIGAHAGTGWQRFLLDDLAQKILTNLDRAVLVIH